MADTAAKSTTAKPRKSPAKASPAAGTTASTPKAANHRGEAKSRFNAALEEARAGAVALGAEARERAGLYRSEATTRGSAYAGDAKTKASALAKDGKAKASALAKDGKAKASEALVGLSKMVNDNVATVDDNLGSQYGDYARSASRKLQETAEALDRKSVEELGEDAREFVRKSPGTALGLAAVAGYLLARLLRR